MTSNPYILSAHHLVSGHGTLTKPERLDIALFESAVEVLARLGAVHPGARPDLYDVDVVKGVSYSDTAGADNTLDVYLPTTHPGPWPIVLYVHGGGFRLLSKDTHWMMAMAFARRGYMVVNVNYRLAPKHPFPAALQDVSAAYAWLVRNAERFGGDIQRIVLAGESAGANLISSLAIQTAYRRPEPWAREVFELGVQPRAVVGACGIFDVSGAARLLEGRRLPRTIHDWLLAVRDGYLGALRDGSKQASELADPVRVLESAPQPDRPMPPFFLPVGGSDPLVPDSERMARALKRSGVPSKTAVYPGGGHAFHMATFLPLAKRLWNDTFDFLKEHVPANASRASKVRPFAPTRTKSSNWLQERIINLMAA
ncbi:MAG: alpha/beta hydrolase [Myxococcota bacterium]